MQILDGKDHHRGRYEKFVGDMVVHYLNGGGHWGTLDWAHPGNSSNAEVLERATTTFQKTLRELVDQLIETGVDQDGIETPSNRRVRASVDEPPIPLFEVLHEWLGRNMPKPALMNDGTIAILETLPLAHGKDPNAYARDMAIYYFKDILESPARSRIGKCANRSCQKYFVRQRERRSAIKRGTYCGKCKLVGAAERTRISRLRRKVQMLSIAAEAWSRWEKRPVRTDRAKWVATQVNRKFGRWQFVGQNGSTRIKRRS